MKKLLILIFLVSLYSCKEDDKKVDEIKEQSETTAAAEEREFKVLDSKYINKDSLWSPLKTELDSFSDARYNMLMPMIMDKTIPELQNSIKIGDFTYEDLAKFYLTRIYKFDRNNEISLNSVISLNPNILEEARARDKGYQQGKKTHPIYGIPVLVKDNINTKDMATTGGAAALQDNITGDAFIIKRLKEQGALILGKANLSEWAYFFCEDCPSGYSAVGGQTLNPYGRKILDTGGSSSGSAVAVAANFAPVAIGSETSGSILSPSSQNSLVGLKPTVGVLSRGGIIPISGTLDTPGPISKFVVDNAILFSAMTGKDAQDPASVANKNRNEDFYSNLGNGSLEGKRFGAMKPLMEDSLYVQAVEDLRKAGAEVIVYEPEEIELPNFIRLLNLDMKKDLPGYFEKYGGDVEFSSVQDVMDFNAQDTLLRSPYGQELFEGIVADSATPKEFAAIKDTLRTNGKRFFDVPMQKHKLDAILSINNYHAGFAAVAHYPAITVPMGYGENNAPKGLTIISTPFTEEALYNFAMEYEQVSQMRKSPEIYNK